MKQADNDKDATTSWFVRAAFAGVAGLSLFAVWALVSLAASRGDPMSSFQLDHRSWALIAMSIAACSATALVTGLRAIDREITFELIGIKASRAGALLVGWLAVFGAIILAFHALR